jgi:hypothetical protein
VMRWAPDAGGNVWEAYAAGSTFPPASGAHLITNLVFLRRTFNRLVKLSTQGVLFVERGFDAFGKERSADRENRGQ